MEEIGGVHEFEAFQDLVDDILFVDVLQDVSSDYSMQVCVHEVKYQVDVSVIFGPDHVLKPNDILMTVELLQKDDLSECSLGVCRILKSVKVLLQSHYLLGFLIDSFPNNTICSLS